MIHYENPECKDIDEFSDDVNRVKYLKSLFNRYEQEGDFKSRLVLNHIIVFKNVFGILPATRILFFRIDERYHSILKTCLSFLEILPPNIPDIEISNIPIDHIVLNKLRKELWTN